MKILNFANIYMNYTYFVEDLGSNADNSVIKNMKNMVGGKGFNISLSLVNAQAPRVYQAGILGEDSQELLTELKNNNININNIKIINQPGGYSLVFIDKYGRFRRFYNPGVEENISKEFVDSILKHFTAEDFIILDDNLPCTDYLISAANNLGMLVCFCPEKLTDNFDGCKYVFLTSENAFSFSGKSEREELIDFLKENYPENRFIIYFENEGFLYVGKTRTYFQGCFEAERINKSVCFDYFIGVFLAFTARGKKLSTAMKYAAAAVALSGSVGEESIVPTYFQLTDALKNLKEKDSSGVDRIKRIWNLTEKYIDANITNAKISELSAVLGYSEAYTGELIKTSLGVSFSELLQKKRCTLAAKMLKSTQLSVNEIIKAVGYENETFFRNKFKAIFGMTPREFRKNR